MQKNLLFGGLLAVALLVCPATANAGGLDQALENGLNTTGMSNAEAAAAANLSFGTQFAILAFLPNTNLQSVRTAGTPIGIANAFFQLGFTYTGGPDITIIAQVVEFYAVAKVLIDFSLSIYIPAVLADPAFTNPTARGNLQLAVAQFSQLTTQYMAMNTAWSTFFNTPLPLFPPNL
jgi:hypothetical protein